MNFNSYEFLHFLEAEIYLINKIKSRAPKMAKTEFLTARFCKVDST